MSVWPRKEDQGLSTPSPTHRVYLESRGFAPGEVGRSPHPKSGIGFYLEGEAGCKKGIFTGEDWLSLE